MEKISGILPSSSRVSSVDMRDAAPIRPGTPSFGRPEGVSSLRDAKIGETAARAAKINQDRLDWKSKDLNQAAMAREISESFFINRKAGAMKDMDVDSVNSGTSGIGGIGGVAVGNVPPAMMAPKASAPAGFDSSIDSVIESVTSDFSDLTPDLAPVESTESTQSDAPAGLYPRGSFVDVRA
jgi:hypothetical protein